MKPNSPRQEFHSQKHLDQGMFQAIRDGDADALCSFIDRGANLRALEERGFTPLSSAAYLRQTACILALIPRCGLGHRDSFGRDALMLAIAGHNAPESAPAVFRLLLGCCRTGKETDSSGHTHLHLAAACGQPEAIKLLLPLSDPNFANGQGHTPLALAIFSGNEQEALLLLPHTSRRACIAAASEAGKRGLTHLADMVNSRLALDEKAQIEQGCPAGPAQRSSPKL